jgi:hypothetical protein
VADEGVCRILIVMDWFEGQLISLIAGGIVVAVLFLLLMAVQLISGDSLGAAVRSNGGGIVLGLGGAVLGYEMRRRNKKRP